MLTVVFEHYAYRVLDIISTYLLNGLWIGLSQGLKCLRFVCAY